MSSVLPQYRHTTGTGSATGVVGMVSMGALLSGDQGRGRADRGRCRGRSWVPVGAADPGGVVDEVADLGVVEVGGFHQVGYAAFGDEVGHALVGGADGGGGEPGFGP